MDSRTIEVTKAALKHGNLNIRKCGKDFFPPDCFGSNTNKTGTGKPITIHAPGIKNPADKVIPVDMTNKGFYLLSR